MRRHLLCDRMKMIQEGFIDMRKGLSNKRSYYLWYTLLFAALAVICSVPFLRAGKGLVAESDGIAQHYAAFTYYGSWLRQIAKTLLREHRLVIPTWDFTIGMGSDVIATLTYYIVGDPLALLSALARPQQAELLYSVLEVFRIWAAGAAFVHYALYRGKSGGGVIAGALAYIGHGYLMFVCFRQPFFVIPMMILPLLLEGAEKMLAGGKPYHFILMVWLALSSNFYLSYVLVLAVIFYVIGRYLESYRKDFKDFARRMLGFLGYGVLGVCMAGVTLGPVLSAVMGALRSQEGHIVPVLYSPGYYRDLAAAVLSADPIGNWRRYTYLGLAAPVLAAVVTVFAQKKKHRMLKAALAAGLLFLCIPFFGYASNGFSYVCNRWIYLLCGAGAWALTEAWEKLLAPDVRSVRLLSVCCVILLGMYTVFGVMGAPVSVNAWIGLGLFGAVTGVMALRVFRPEGRVTERAAFLCLFAVLTLHIGANWLLKYEPVGQDYVDYFMDAGTAYGARYEKSQAALMKKAYREQGLELSRDLIRGEASRFNVTGRSAAMNCGVYATDVYFSLLNGAVSRHMLDLGITLSTTNNIRGFDAQAMPGTLANVGMYVQRKPGWAIPYGYHATGLVEGTERVYLNDYTLPFGYTYDSVIGPETYAACDATQKAEALMQGAVLTQEGLAEAESLPGTELSLESYHLPVTITEGDGTQILEDGSILVTKEYGSVHLSFDEITASEVSLYLKNVSFEVFSQADLAAYGAGKSGLRAKVEDLLRDPEDDASCELYVQLGAIERIVYLLSEQDSFYWNQEEYALHFGYWQEGVSEMTMKFERPGIFRLGLCEASAQPFDRYAERVNALAKESLREVEIGANRVSGKITVSKEKLLCLSIPYSKGWRVSVDGEERELLQTGTAFSGVALEAGTHEVVLEYRTPGLLAGTVIALTAWSIFAGFVIFLRKKNRGK